MDASLRRASAAGADACLIVVEEHDDEEHLESAAQRARALGLEIVVDVHDEGSLTASLERIDPEIFLLSPARGRGRRGPHLERVLDLLPDVPAGKLAIADLHVTTRDEVLALERAGVDAVLVGSADVAHLVGGAPPRCSRPLAAILALAAALRLIGIEYGLPFGGLLNPDEQNIVPRAWGWCTAPGSTRTGSTTRRSSSTCWRRSRPGRTSPRT